MLFTGIATVYDGKIVLVSSEQGHVPATARVRLFRAGFNGAIKRGYVPGKIYMSVTFDNATEDARQPTMYYGTYLSAGIEFERPALEQKVVELLDNSQVSQLLSLEKSQQHTDSAPMVITLKPYENIRLTLASMLLKFEEESGGYENSMFKTSYERALPVMLPVTFQPVSAQETSTLYFYPNPLGA